MKSLPEIVIAVPALAVGYGSRCQQQNTIHIIMPRAHGSLSSKRLPFHPHLLDLHERFAGVGGWGGGGTATIFDESVLIQTLYRSTDFLWNVNFVKYWTFF